jgi:hypothetical protein
LPGGINDAQAIIAQAKKMELKLTFLVQNRGPDEFIQPAISGG